MIIHSNTAGGGPGPAAPPSGEGTLPVVLDAGQPAPYYQQIAGQVRRLILSGRLPAGTLLPSVRALALQLGTSVITTRHAYEELERAGLIVSRQGTGSFVAPLGPEDRRQERESQARARLAEAVDSSLGLGVAPERVRQMLDELLTERARARTGETPGSDRPGTPGGRG